MPTGQRWTSQNGQLVRVDLGIGGNPVLARQGSMVMCQGKVDFGYKGAGFAGRIVGDAYQLNTSGRGKVALMTSGRPLMMRVTPDKYVSADADAVVAWSTALRVQTQAQTHSSGIRRRRGDTGEGWKLSFLGQGFALVQPSEVTPPQSAAIGRGPAAQYGVGRHGAHGQNQNNAWSR
ncbi:AIM24 family protein [Streptomyces sp. NPDC087658]|uniref:AIM24 family protein n=1 Tax=Streptomyces sp. NPDC087658 TaxID=3365800 RepID=UPI00381E4E43